MSSRLGWLRGDAREPRVFPETHRSVQCPSRSALRLNTQSLPRFPLVFRLPSSVFSMLSAHLLRTMTPAYLKISLLKGR